MEKTVQNIPFLRVVIALAFGISLGSAITIHNSFILFAAIIFIAILTIIINKIYNYKLQLLPGLLFNLFFVSTGIYFYHSSNKAPEFYSNGIFEATLLESPLEKTNSYQSIAKLNFCVKNDSLYPANEKVIIYFAKANSIDSIQPGNIIRFSTNPQRIKNFGNPYEFDYKMYLERRKIYRQVYLDEPYWSKIKRSKNTITVHAEKSRQKLLKIYKRLPIDENELEILSALTLGYKRDLDPETKRVFSSAGAMHVLAVSGLHVGIIFWIIVLLFGSLRKHKTGRILFTVISLIILWCYAFITGLSPSVMRAATMFTIYIFSELLQRRASIYNSLSAAAFFLLIINPNNLFETGFQLSFSAVFGIVYLQPKMSSLIKLNNKIVRFFWELLTVSCAAQLATLPFVLFYFNQFPSYFFLTNTIIIPAIMLLIPLGIFLLIISGIPFIAYVISVVINGIIKSIFNILILIEQIPNSVLNISISRIQQLLLISIIATFFILLKTKKARHFNLTLLFTILLIISTLYQNIADKNIRELIIYNNPENVILELIHDKTNYIISENEISENAPVRRAIAQTTQKRNLVTPNFFTLKDTVVNNYLYLKNGTVFFEGKIIFIGSDRKYNYDLIKPDIIINPTKTSTTSIKNDISTLVVTNKSLIKYLDEDRKLIYHSAFETAFRKIW